MNTIDAMKQADTALASVEAVSIDTIGAARGSLREAIAREEAQTVEPAGVVYLVATGEITNGMEQYTRHDVCPPLCDAEKLFKHPAPPPSAAVPDVWTPEELEKVIERAAEYSDWYVHATPKPPAKPQPLTDARILSIWRSLSNQDVYTFSRAIEAAHGITGEPT